MICIAEQFYVISAVVVTFEGWGLPWGMAQTQYIVRWEESGYVEAFYTYMPVRPRDENNARVHIIGSREELRSQFYKHAAYAINLTS